MDNTAAIKGIKYVKDTFGVAFSDLDHEALALGIKALEEREKRLKLMVEYQKCYDNPELQYDEDMSKIILKVLKECE